MAMVLRPRTRPPLKGVVLLARMLDCSLWTFRCSSRPTYRKPASASRLNVSLRRLRDRLIRPFTSVPQNLLVDRIVTAPTDEPGEATTSPDSWPVRALMNGRVRSAVVGALELNP